MPFDKSNIPWSLLNKCIAKKPDQKEEEPPPLPRQTGMGRGEILQHVRSIYGDRLGEAKLREELDNCKTLSDYSNYTIEKRYNRGMPFEDAPSASDSVPLSRIRTPPGFHSRSPPFNEDNKRTPAFDKRSPSVNKDNKRTPAFNRRSPSANKDKKRTPPAANRRTPPADNKVRRQKNLKWRKFDPLSDEQKPESDQPTTSSGGSGTSGQVDDLPRLFSENLQLKYRNALIQNLKNPESKATDDLFSHSEFPALQ